MDTRVEKLIGDLETLIKTDCSGGSGSSRTVCDDEKEKAGKAKVELRAIVM